MLAASFVDGTSSKANFCLRPRMALYEPELLQLLLVTSRGRQKSAGGGGFELPTYYFSFYFSKNAFYLMKKHFKDWIKVYYIKYNQETNQNWQDFIFWNDWELKENLQLFLDSVRYNLFLLLFLLFSSVNSAYYCLLKMLQSF